MKPKKLSLLVLFFFLCTILAPAAYMPAAIAGGGAASGGGSGAIDSVVAELQSVYQYFDEADKEAMKAARSKVDGITETQWDTILGVGTENALLTTEVNSRFTAQGKDAKNEMTAFAKGLAGIYYSSDSATLKDTLVNFKNNYKDSFQILFGTDITVDELYKFLSDSRAQLPNVITATDAGLLANASVDELVNKMPGYLKEAMQAALEQNTKFQGKLTEIGWSVDKLINQQVELAKVVDAGNAAQYAVAKAAVRLETKLGANAPLQLKVGDKPEYTILIMGKDATKFVAFASSNDKVVKVSQEAGTGNFILEAVGSGTAMITVYRDYNGATPEKDWLLKFEVAAIVVAEEDQDYIVTPETPVTVEIPSGVENFTLKIAVTEENGKKVTTLPQVALNKATNIGTVAVNIPSGTKVTGPKEWTGEIQCPKVVAKPAATIKGDNIVVLQLGAPTGKVTFDKPVLLVMPDQKGKKVSYIVGGETTPHEIPENSKLAGLESGDKYAAAAVALGAAEDGNIDHSNAKDKIIWTKHFTQFVAYTPKSTSGGGGGGGSAPSGTLVKASEGGEISEYDATVTIPAKAFAADFRVKIDKVTDKAKQFTPEDAKLLSYVLDITKDKSADFSKLVTITLSFDKKAYDADKYDISLYWYDKADKQWVELDNVKADLEAGTISGETNHFTMFAVLATLKAGEEEPPVPPAVELSDITGHWAEANIKSLVSNGAIAGYPDQTFKPDNTITRAEFATVLVKAFNLEAKAGKVFNDTVNHWGKDYIATAAAYGIVAGYDANTFGPDDFITREQMALMIVKATGLADASEAKVFADSDKVSAWAKQAVAIASSNNIITGYPDNTYKPQGKATRAEAVTVIKKSPGQGISLSLVDADDLQQ
ncbi:S-layer homology domain-containing protein [Syntrophomonas erecta]